LPKLVLLVRFLGGLDSVAQVVGCVGPLLRRLVGLRQRDRQQRLAELPGVLVDLAGALAGWLRGLSRGYRCETGTQQRRKKYRGCEGGHRESPEVV
jgi:hypothetical protein